MMLCGEVLCVTIHRVDQDKFSTIAFGVTIPSALNNGQCAMIICYLTDVRMKWRGNSNVNIVILCTSVANHWKMIHRPAMD